MVVGITSTLQQILVMGWDIATVITEVHHPHNHVGVQVEQAAIRMLFKGLSLITGIWYMETMETISILCTKPKEKAL
jgi:hypothetical protein